MQVFTVILASALANAPLPTYHVSDAKSAGEHSWTQVAVAQDRQCVVEVTGEGRFFRISMTGFAPGEIGQFHLENGNTRPVSYHFKSDEDGKFSKIYLPFMWHRQGGTVSVSAKGKACNVGLSFPWTRAAVNVH